MKRTKRILAAIMSCAMIFALTACGGNSGTEGDSSNANLKAIPKDQLKIGFVYVGPVGDEGYSYAHDQGRKKMIESLGLSEDQVIIKESVPENADCESAERYDRPGLQRDFLHQLRLYGFHAERGAAASGCVFLPLLRLQNRG